VVRHTQSGAIVGEGVVVMPHLGTWERFEGSSFLALQLEAGKTYRVELQGADEATNMSELAHFEAYTAGLGGQDGAFNRVNVRGLKILAR
jgi:hypothetical protein